MKNKEICKKLKSVLIKFPKLIAIFNNGSTIVGTDTPESDIDFTIIVKNKNDISKVLSILKKNFKFLGIDHEVPLFKYKKRELAICVYDKKTMDFFVNVLYKSKDDFLRWQDTLQHKIIEAIPIYDPQKLLSKYKKKVLLYPTKIQKEVFSDSIKALKEIFEEWTNYRFKNEFNFIFHLPEILEKICLAIYSKNKKLFMIPYKRLDKDLKELKPNIEKEIYFLVKGTNSKKNLEEKKRILKKIIIKLEK